MGDPENHLEADSLVVAKSRVQNGPVPDWANQTAYDASFKSTHERHVTFLLYSTQVQAERHAVYVHNVVRLETMEAVQHWSQWRLQFEPKNQLVTLHFLKVRRGDVEIDQSKIEKARLLQREEGLEKFIIHGWFTLLMVLEDVRAGDVLDIAYTIETQSKLFPDHGAHIFTPPHGVAIGKYYFATRFNPARQRQWKSSSADLAPQVAEKDGLIAWEWQGEIPEVRKAEPNAPSWHLSYPWIQVSDFTDWQMIAAGIAKAWAQENSKEAVAEMVKEIESKEPDLPSRIENAIRFVQDECRYLSVNLELGGQIPTSPEIVNRRRFGDCKDLSFLLANLLNGLGAKARPVLVNVFLRKSIEPFLPTPSLFNHVVVEFEADGKKRWVDTTLNEQGGGAFGRSVPHFALGLPVDPDATGLVAISQVEQSHLYDLRERVLLDTANNPSLMEVVLHAEGNQADNLRHQLKKSGMEGMAAQRLQAMINRFGNATRVGEIKYRDDRAANRFVLAEVFEIKFYMTQHANPKLCRVNLPSHWLGRVLLMPEKKERQAPFLLPCPCSIKYLIEVECQAIKNMKLAEPYVEAGNAFVKFHRTNRAGHGFFTMEFSLVTSTDVVPAEETQKHGEVVEKIFRACARELSLMRGYARPREKSGFGELPSLDKKSVPISAKRSTPPPLPMTASGGTHRLHRRKRKIPVALLWVMGLIIFYLLVVVLLNQIKH